MKKQLPTYKKKSLREREKNMVKKVLLRTTFPKVHHNSFTNKKRSIVFAYFLTLNLGFLAIHNFSYLFYLDIFFLALCHCFQRYFSRCSALISHTWCYCLCSFSFNHSCNLPNTIENGSDFKMDNFKIALVRNCSGNKTWQLYNKF